MDSAALATALDAALKDLKLLEHPWYVRWTNGELSRDELRDYAEQYRHFEATLPPVLREIAAELPEGQARDLVIENLDDETGANGSTSHVELFDSYIDVLDGAHDAPASPAMQRLVGTYAELVKAGPIEALSGVMAYEVQAADIADSKGKGLKEKYDMVPAQTAFWDLHATLDIEHGEWSLSSLAELVDNADVVTESARRTAVAWWNFLDERETLRAAAA